MVSVKKGCHYHSKGGDDDPQVKSTGKHDNFHPVKSGQVPF